MELLQPLLAIVLARSLLGDGRPPAPEEIGLSLAAFTGWLAVAWVLARARVRTCLTRGESFHVPAREALLQLVLYGALLGPGGWGRLAAWATGGLPIVSTLAAFLPFVAARVLRCIAAHEVERATPGRQWTLREYVVFNVRTLLLPVLPILVVGGILDAILGLDALEPFLGPFADLVLPPAVILLFAGVFGLSPVLVRWVLGARPLPPGPLRDRLDAYGARARFRPTDVLVWNTGRTITNALFIGILPRFRYVVLTDALVELLDPLAVEAVYAHEAGHGARRHTLIYLLLAVGMVLWSWFGILVGGPAIETALLDRAFPPDVAATVTTVVEGVWAVALMAAFFILGFGFASRRFETEADIHAISTIEEPDHFARALETVGLHLGILRRKGGIRHFGVGRRIGLINRWRCEPDFRESFTRVLRRLRIAAVAVPVLGLAWFGTEVPELLREGRIVRDFGAASRDNDERGLASVLETVNSGPEGSSRWKLQSARIASAAISALGDAALRRGDVATARVRLEELRAALRPWDRVGEANVGNLEVLIDALEGRGSAPAIRGVVESIESLAARGGLAEGSLQETYSDLLLAHRASGGVGSWPGDRDSYSAAGRLLMFLESDPEAATRQESVPSELLDAARQDFLEAIFRRELFRRAAKRLWPSTWVSAL